MNYNNFLQSKILKDTPSGFEPLMPWLDSCQLFPFQKALVEWAVKRGRAAIFADTGLGKTRMQLSWAQQIHQYSGNRVLILAPLCVAQQTVAEGSSIGVTVKYVRESHEIGETGIYITNYEMLKNCDDWIRKGYFDGIVLDESSILKNQDGKTRKYITELAKQFPYRLSCTATPSPNDYMELGTQAEFLGIMPMNEMLAMFFIHDAGETSKWRLKGHGKTKFWEWMSGWAAFVKKPSDLGFDDTGYDLPELIVKDSTVTTGRPVASTLSERLQARRESISERVKLCADLVNGSTDSFIVWCNLNDESSMLKDLIPDAVEIRGSDSIKIKEERIQAFTEGRARVIITKPSITGFGLNWQHCHRMAFVGLSDSFEDLYQAIRRCYRFGQTKNVEVNLITADTEGAVKENILRKEAQAKEMSDAMITHMRDFCKREVRQLETERAVYNPEKASSDNFTLYLGDCVEVAQSLPDESIDYSIFSPPFSSLYTYSNSHRDMGNSKNDAEFFKHFKFLVNELFRIMRSGRVMSIHCMNLTTSKQNHGVIGIRDFRGDLIRLFTEAGFIYCSEVTVWKDPVVAMQRTKALGLLWKQIKKDSTMSRQGLPDYVVSFRKPGENVDPVSHTPEEFPVLLWQQLASPCWNDIKQSNTLNRKLAREDDDERHIAPLQLDLIERCVFLWSKQGDTVFSPFTGIGSEGYVSLAMGRKFIGSELKRSYFDIAKNNLKQAEEIIYSFPHFQKSIGGWMAGQVQDQKQEFVPTDSRTDFESGQLDWTQSTGVMN